jgi:hypothetical protein
MIFGPPHNLNFTRKADDTGTRGFYAARCRCSADEVLAGSHVLAGHMPTLTLQAGRVKFVVGISAY